MAVLPDEPGLAGCPLSPSLLRLFLNSPSNLTAIFQGDVD